MGIVNSGAPTELIEALARAAELPVFVETGTFNGDTAAWASGLFESVITIELSEELHRAARERLALHPNVEVRLGDSRGALREIVSTLDRPALFWLDAHWSGGPTAGEHDRCPLLEEIEIVLEARHDRYVLIDDARLFTAPPPQPHRPEDWPNARAVLNALGDERLSDAVIVADVIAAVPPKAWPVLVDYSRLVSAREWDEHVYRTAPSIRQGAELMRHGAALTLAGLKRRARV